jgi:hypothetical protein
MLLATGGRELNPGPTAGPAETDNAQIPAYVMHLGMQGKVIERILGSQITSFRRCSRKEYIFI